MNAIKSNSKDLAFILCVIGWIMNPEFCDVTPVGTVRTGKGSGWTVTEKKKEIGLH